MTAGLSLSAAWGAGRPPPRVRLLGHAAATTTDRYIRERVGRVVTPFGAAGDLLCEVERSPLRRKSFVGSLWQSRFLKVRPSY